MLLIGDAPSLEKPLSDYTLTDVVNRSKQDRIALNLYPIVISSINNSDEVGTPSAEIPSSPQPKAVNLLHSVFPNPANNVVSVRFLTPDNTNMIEILDMNGKKVKEKPCEDISWDFYVGDLPAGNYIVRAYNAKLEYQTEKLIIQH